VVDVHSPLPANPHEFVGVYGADHGCPANSRHHLLPFTASSIKRIKYILLLLASHFGIMYSNR
jgi:hypothetical protein